jgi:hypothetical protein
VQSRGGFHRGDYFIALHDFPPLFPALDMRGSAPEQDIIGLLSDYIREHDKCGSIEGYCRSSATGRTTPDTNLSAAMDK